MTDNPAPTATSPSGTRTSMAVRFDADACRAWLHGGAADEHFINDADVTTTEASIAAAVARLLQALHDDPQPAVWSTTGGVQHVQAFRTADGDGIDGGAIITIDLIVARQPLRLAGLHLAFDDFTADEATAGIDAAVEALGTVAALANHALADLHHVLDPGTGPEPGGFTVVGVWDGDEPRAVGVIAGDHQVSEGDTDWDGGLWAEHVTAPDPHTAQHAALALMRATLHDDDNPDA